MLYDPEDAITICPCVIAIVLLSGVTKPSAILIGFTGLNRFNLTIYGLQYPYLRLTVLVTKLCSRLGIGYIGSMLSE